MPKNYIWHVTDYCALPRIKREGLKSAKRLVEELVDDPAEQRRLLRQPRPSGQFHQLAIDVSLRDQRMDAGILSRCLRGISTEDWLHELNGYVFFWRSRKDAIAHVAVNPGRDQVVLAIDRDGMMAKHRASAKWCRFNSGAPSDRGNSRRGPDTFVAFPADRWPAQVKEVVIAVQVPDAADYIAEVWHAPPWRRLATW